MEHYYAYVYVRIMQALGAYGFRGFYERKAHFLQSVPYALKNLRWLAANVKLPIALPALMEALERMLGIGEAAEPAAPAADLMVRIFSFSFHHSHARGRVRQRRRLCLRCPQPAQSGREERFRALTGKDAPVIDYLDAESVQEFLARRHVAGGCQRDRISAQRIHQPDGLFGCTGGQHRSVYLAEQLAKHLRGTAGIEVVVRHTEPREVRHARGNRLGACG